jgi:homogentisate 1,2-dioxygenase
MLDRMVVGQVPAKHHTVLRGEDGRIRYEECLTRDGFEGPYTLAYHRERPQAVHTGKTTHGSPVAQGAIPAELFRRHYRGGAMARENLPAIDARRPFLFNDHIVLGLCAPAAADPVYYSNGDGDELLFVFEGSGLLRSIQGELRYEKNDYLFLPRGLIYRLIPDAGPQFLLSLEMRGGLGIPSQWRNPVGQLRMDAPYSHRDFRRPEFKGPIDENIRELTVKKNDRYHGYRYETSPLDLVGWDGSVYPFVFPILNFQPRVGLVHLPPTWHGTFAGSGALVCSFVPRPVDFHPQAIPCPYPHANVNVDEVLFYVSGNFTSRKGIGPASLSFHPAGVAHGPHPGAYEASIGTKETQELAVMLDVYQPLRVTPFAAALEDPAYPDSFSA